MDVIAKNVDFSEAFNVINTHYTHTKFVKNMNMNMNCVVHSRSRLLTYQNCLGVSSYLY